MEDGRNRARSTGRPESVDDILARNGVPGTGGRAARRRAAEELERALSEAGHRPSEGGRRRAPEPAEADLPPAAPRPPAPGFPASRRPAPPFPAPPSRATPPRSARSNGVPPAADSRGSLPPLPVLGGPRPADQGSPRRPTSARTAVTPPQGPTVSRLTHGVVVRRSDESAAERTVITSLRPDDIGSGPQDGSEQAERDRRAERGEAEHTRSQRIDETLIRLTAAHAGLPVPGHDEDAAEAEPPRRRLPRPSAGRLLALALAVLVFGTTTAGWATQAWLGSAVRNVAALDQRSGAILDAGAQKGAENVLLVATDLGAAAAAGRPSPRPDTVVVAHVPAGGGRMTVLSVPTELQINRPPCERFHPTSADYTSEIVPAQARTQLATALDLGGPRCATRVIQQLTGLAITQYVGLDLDRLGAVVDAVSGVRVCVTRPVLDKVLGAIVPDAGTTTLDGSQASDFVRAADVDGDPPADLGRIERQQQVLAGALESTLTTTGLLNVSRIAALRPALGAALTSDGAGLDEILALSLALRGMHDVTFTSVPTTSDGRDSAVLRDADARALFAALRKDAPLPAAAATTDTGPAPGDLRVELLNASGQTGLAARIGDTLRQLGFGVGVVANAPQPTPQTVIRYSPDQTAAAGLLAGTVPAASTVPDPGASGVLQLVLGRSFDGVVKAPSQPAVPAAATARATGCG